MWWQWWRWSLTECRTVAVRWCLPAPAPVCPRSLAWVRAMGPSPGSHRWPLGGDTAWSACQWPELPSSLSPPVLAAEQSSYSRAGQRTALPSKAWTGQSGQRFIIEFIANIFLPYNQLFHPKVFYSLNKQQSIWIWLSFHGAGCSRDREL